MQKPKKYLTVTLVAALTIGADQLIKYFICQRLPKYSVTEVVSDYFNIVHYRNSRIAFGLLKNYGSDYKTASLIIVSCVALLLLFYLITQIKRDQNLQTWGLSLVLGGAVGNLIDRFRLGEVVDFLDFHWHSHHWPAFNIADAAISVGIGLIILDEVIAWRRIKKEQKCLKKNEDEEGSKGSENIGGPEEEE